MAKKGLKVVPKKVITDEEIKKLVDGLRPKVFTLKRTIKKRSDELSRLIAVEGDMRPVGYLIKMVTNPEETAVESAYAARILGECAYYLNEEDRGKVFDAVADTFLTDSAVIDYCVPYTFPGALVSLAGENLEDQRFALEILEDALGKTHSFEGQSRAPIEKFTRGAKEKRKEIIGKAIRVIQGKIIKQEQKERKKVKR